MFDVETFDNYYYCYTRDTGAALCCACAARLTAPEVIAAELLGERVIVCDVCRVEMRTTRELPAGVVAH